ncbi:hypothetical protein CI726_16305 [Shigella sonnei]|uniref:Phage terminase large subunit N-terminal domain-containing protein n=6 Tax=Enterobacterales TaxID=91347 RepID=A0AAE5K356_SHISO|nr:hypothetical protein CI726_16305 [Shigella sonnei]OYG99712.1 hypothetical protein CI727_01590 [Shigella sonnei]
MTSINPIFEPFIEAHRYKVAKGGRGSGKSWAIARLLVEAARRQPVRILCARELQNSISDSVIRLLEDTIEREGYSAEFEIQRSMIRHLGTNAEFMFYGIKNNPTKIKSLEGIDICWVEEAEAVTKESWDILIPTIRKPFSEIWVSFNPKNILDDTYQRFVVNPPDDICLLTVNYTDNPHFPEVLRLEMEECKRRNPTLYRHIWLGEPVSASDMAIIKREWLEAATDAHKKLGWKAKGAVVSAHDPSDTGPDAKGYASRHGSVVKLMITFKPTRNIDLIEAVGNHPDIIVGSNNGDGYDYKPECRYFEVNVHGQFGGIVYYQEIQPLTFDCHAMYLPEIRGFSKEIGLAFWRYILTNTTVQCVTSFAARKFRHGQIYCAMIGLKRVGTIKKYFKGVDDVTFYSATREELIDFLNHGR